MSGGQAKLPEWGGPTVGGRRGRPPGLGDHRPRHRAESDIAGSARLANPSARIAVPSAARRLLRGRRAPKGPSAVTPNAADATAGIVASPKPAMNPAPATDEPLRTAL